MPTLYHVALFLALAFGFSNASIVARLQDNQTMDNINSDPQAGIQIRIALPKQALAVDFKCDSGDFMVDPEKDHQWSVPIDKVDNCIVGWGHSSASFNAFDPQTDAGHTVVYWLVKLDGFYHSWDNLNWVKKADWNH